MKLLFKQRLFSWFSSFDIYFENGSAAFTVEGQPSWGKKLHILTPEGEHIATVKQIVMSLRPRYEFYINGELFGTMKKEFAFFTPIYHIDSNGWQVDGSFFEHDYKITDKNGSRIAEIGKELFHFTDTYTITVDSGKDALCALMVTLAIDAEKAARAAAGS